NEKNRSFYLRRRCSGNECLYQGGSQNGNLSWLGSIWHHVWIGWHDRRKHQKNAVFIRQQYTSAGRDHIEIGEKRRVQNQRGTAKGFRPTQKTWHRWLDRHWRRRNFCRSKNLKRRVWYSGHWLSRHDRQ